MRDAVLERDDELRILDEALDDAASGRGSAALVLGPAGIGKTSLVRSFVAAAGARARLFVGACDDLLTPRTLGPFRDMARASKGKLAAAVAEGSDRDAVFGAVLDELAVPTTVMVVEDVHWADDATLDVIRFLSRRISSVSGMLVLTYRDDELRDDHPLSRVLGSFAGQDVHRLHLLPLSLEAVRDLSRGSDVDVDALFGATEGNPFFVAEALAAPDAAVPATVRDAVLGRARTLTPSTQEALQVLSVVPVRMERWLAETLVPDAVSALEEAEQRGVLRSDAGRVWFRHEIARRAIQQSLSVTARLEHNRRVLQVLKARTEPDLAQIVHHAREADDPEAVVRFGLQAGAEAAQAGANREALAHYEQVLRFPKLLANEERAEVLERYAWQLHNAHLFHEAVERGRESLHVWQGIGDQRRIGEGYTTLSRFLYLANDPRGSYEAAQEAVSLLEPLGETKELAAAYSYLGAILKLIDRYEEAIDVSKKAREVAERVDRPDIVSHSLNYIGGALVDLGDADGLDDLREAARIASSIGHHEYTQRAYTNLVEGLYRLGKFDVLEDAIDAGLAFALDHDLDAHRYNIGAHRCMLWMLQGRWDDAEEELWRLAQVPDPGVLASFGLSALGRLLARKGDERATGVVDDAWKAATRTATVQSLAWAGTARVERAWLSGEYEQAKELARIPLERTSGKGGERYRAEILRYLKLAGHEVEVFDGCPEEYAAAFSGDWREAAAYWERVGAPYERAIELTASEEVEPMLEGLSILDELGAAPAAALTRRRLRDLGMSRIPRGPQTSTRANPAGLTDRQVDVLSLLSQGFTNAEIADQLVVSPRTVDHHVSAILSKLGAETRREAARMAQDLGVSQSA